MGVKSKNESIIIVMTWEDRTRSEAIELEYGINESAVIRLMRSRLKRRSFQLWRARVSGWAMKHLKLRSSEITRGYCPTQ
jgi:uncharacterized protein (TIGR03643 family)